MKTDMGSVCTYVWQAKILVKILNYDKVDISFGMLAQSSPLYSFYSQFYVFQLLEIYLGWS